MGSSHLKKRLWLHPGVENGARNASGPCQPNIDLT
jgi:hypothetical protein